MKECANPCCDKQITKRNYCDACRKYKSRNGSFPTWEAVINRRNCEKESWQDHETLMDPFVMGQIF